MKKVGVAILGLGVVGGGTYKILTDNKEYFKKTQGLDITVESVLELNKERALSLGVPESNIASSISEVISNPNVDIVVEVIGGVKVAKDFVLKAILSGKSVVTSNKELVAKYWHELEAEAKKMGVGLYFEASCVGGVPIIRTLIDGMQANNITTLKGIVNGTTNYILTKMTEDGADYDEVLKEAQKLGYAEANPTADVEGFDSTYKISILSSIAFNKKVPYEVVSREGITSITKEDIAYAKDSGYVIKLLAIAKNSDKGIEVRVNPALIKKSNPLASVNDSFNAVFLHGDSVDDIMLYGRGAGALPTGSAIVSDVIYAAQHTKCYYAPFKNNATADKTTKFVNDFETKYFIRLTLENVVGTISKLTAVFAKNGINLTYIKQDPDNEGNAKLVLITDLAFESSVNKSIEKISSMKEVKSVDSILRVED
ncbi:MAG: homoserine dehydrogenase [Clostridia bacterium]|nr:homoserine dehydrogenase [Clostridia bacterium]